MAVFVGAEQHQEGRKAVASQILSHCDYKKGKWLLAISVARGEDKHCVQVKKQFTAPLKTHVTAIQCYPFVARTTSGSRGILLHKITQCLI